MKSSSNILHCMAAAAALAVISGCAGQPSQVAANAEATTVEQCDKVTGSRISPDARNECKPLGYPFRSYSSEDLESTGHINVADALRSIDPAFR